jgi:hypothetical protein
MLGKTIFCANLNLTKEPEPQRKQVKKKFFIYCFTV